MTMNRRSFLQIAGASSAGCALASFLPGTLGALAPSPLIATGKRTPSICEMCSTRCPISARVVDGRNVSILGNPNAKAFGGKVCARGGSGHSLLYDPDRLVKPLKRIGKRGAGQWQTIEWDEAYALIAERMQQIKQQHGAESIAFTSKSGSLANHLFHLSKAFGSPNTFTHASTCPNGYVVAAKALFGGGVKRDIGGAKYIINFGHNLYEGINMSETRAMMQAQMDKGAKLVVFDPRFSICADKADEWYPIRPGTDLAIALALSQVLIEERLYDAAFVDQYVEGFAAFAQQVRQYTPEWAAEQTDVPAADIRRIARELAHHAPHAMVDFGHRTTFTPEEFDLRRTLYGLNVLIGNIERKGGLYMGKKAKGYNQLAGEKVAPTLAKPGVASMPTISAPRIDQADPQLAMAAASGGVSQSVLDAVLEQTPYAIKGWIISRNNPMQTIASRGRVEQALKALDLVVVCDVYITETAALADIILPESTYLERDEEISDISGKSPTYYVRQKAVEVIGDTRPSWQIWQQLGHKLGLSQYYPWDSMSTLQLAQTGNDASLLNHIKQQGFVSYGEPLLLREPASVNTFCGAYPNAREQDPDQTFASAMRFNTPSGKIELSSAKVEALSPGRGVIRYRPVKLKQDNELYFIQGKVAVHTNGATHNIPMLAELMSDNAVWIHPDTAAPHGIKNGDAIELANRNGTEQGTALITQGIRPDTVFAYMGFGAKNPELKRATGRGVHCGNLLPHSVAPICGMSLHTAGVTLRKI
ncbi:thiosulfate reductase PhsA [Ferrimonas pelagia]|uniref:Thiosulfate reductase PhsA n=1 Tax=Ferrimonas pelagia TaxID=1177826 RepID=A0ABP9FAF7_9GAMM